jgi:hypothetical protein
MLFLVRNMIYPHLLLAIATLIVVVQEVSASPTPKRHDADTVGKTSYDQYISACPNNKPDFQAGLCYKNCRQGYNGVGPLCWKGSSSYGRGAGVVPPTVNNPYVHGGLPP